jgi:hypothetical protein
MIGALVAACVDAGLGIWLVASPLAITYTSRDSVWNPVAAGAVVAVLAVAAAGSRAHRPLLALGTMAVGLWLALSGLWLEHGTAAALNAASCGAAIALIAVYGTAAAAEPAERAERLGGRA